MVVGERVQVRTVRAESVEAEDERGVRIDYAKRDVNPLFPTFWRGVGWFRYVVDEFRNAAAPAIAASCRRLGGTRQVVFAVGMAMVLGGLGSALSRDGGVAMTMTLGGLLIGLSLRIAALKG